MDTSNLDTKNIKSSTLYSTCNLNSDCPSGLVCENNRCYKPLFLGANCSYLYECVNDAKVCNGFCSSEEPGVLDKPCPCEFGFDCLVQQDKSSIVKFQMEITAHKTKIVFQTLVMKILASLLKVENLNKPVILTKNVKMVLHVKIIHVFMEVEIFEEK